MNRPRLIRGLRIAWSVWWGILGVLLVVLWVRSYRYVEDIAVWRTTSAQVRIVPPEWILFNMLGSIGIDYFPDPSPFATREWERSRSSVDEIRPSPPGPTFLGFYVEVSPIQREFVAPHWFLVLITVALAAFPWIRQLGWRFSLRTLLIATSLIAVVLGLVVIMRR
jgi:hypothetical protein